jgi:hypothetical protein
MTVCENCLYEVRDGKKHIGDGDGNCRIFTVEEDGKEALTGFAHRKLPRDLYRKK